MSGIYIHIPFCRKACVYCDFHFSTSLKRKEEMIDAIGKEIELQQHFLPNKKLDSIYFGGGTPSVLEDGELNKIFEVIYKHFSVSDKAEITLEANPDDLSTVKIEELASGPVNRLSVGVQSFRDEDLKMMNRSHNAGQAEMCIKDAQEKGFENLSIDLIYGIPGMSHAEWRAQLDKALELKVPHISSYALTVEPKTALAYKIEKGEIPEVSDTDSALQFEMLWTILQANGFEQYEVSNFAQKNFRAVHNSSYWEGKSYLGIGPSAHSFKPGIRQWNVSNNPLYIKSISNGSIPSEKEELNEKDTFNEWIMTSLRRREGVSLEKVKAGWGDQFYKFLLNEASALIEEGKLIHEGSRLYIPQQWRFYSDGIASALFYI